MEKFDNTRDSVCCLTTDEIFTGLVAATKTARVKETRRAAANRLPNEEEPNCQPLRRGARVGLF